MRAIYDQESLEAKQAGELGERQKRVFFLRACWYAFGGLVVAGIYLWSQFVFGFNILLTVLAALILLNFQINFSGGRLDLTFNRVERVEGQVHREVEVRMTPKRFKHYYYRIYIGEKVFTVSPPLFYHLRPGIYRIYYAPNHMKIINYERVSEGMEADRTENLARRAYHFYRLKRAGALAFLAMVILRFGPEALEWAVWVLMSKIGHPLG